MDKRLTTNLDSRDLDRDSVKGAVISEKHLQESRNMPATQTRGEDEATQNSMDNPVSSGFGVGHREGDLRREVDGGVRLAGGRLQEHEPTAEDFSESGSSSLSDKSRYTLPPAYSSHFG